MAQPEPKEKTSLWYALNNLSDFIASLEQDDTQPEIDRAIHSLKHHMVDQFDWQAEYSTKISDFCDRAEAVLRGLTRQQGNSGRE